ncbi:multidrug transporter [Myxococcaceae bacterium JPH2]|nr:multidrug transporter [Myxococcaceae bacterium JPH2]
MDRHLARGTAARTCRQVLRTGPEGSHVTRHPIRQRRCTSIRDRVLPPTLGKAPMHPPPRRARLALLFVPLLALALQPACGDEPGEPQGPGPSADAGPKDAGPEQRDAGPEWTDAGPTDAGPDRSDAGPSDAGPTEDCAAVPDEPLPPPPVVRDTTVDILTRLTAIPGLTVRENPDRVPVPSGYRFFTLEYDQPADHNRPGCQRFTQRLTLLHKLDVAPMVFYNSGYFVGPTAGRRELTALLSGNQLSIEHRYFPPSIPKPTDWSLLTIRQSAADYHRVIQALKAVYTGKWISTGASKGGETAVFHRRFYPNDVDGTVAYVAPLARADDERFPAFQAAVGGDAQAECRERMHTFQRVVLGRRERMLTLFQNYATSQGKTFTRLGIEKAFEHCVIESYFAFWQYYAPSDCSAFLGDSATDAELMTVLQDYSPLETFMDEGNSGVVAYQAYYYQAAVELGWPKPYDDHLGALVHFPDTDTGPQYAPPGVPLPFRPESMQDIRTWVTTQGERLMFIYGELDPWTAAAYPLGQAKDSFLFQAPGANHGSLIRSLSVSDNATATQVVRRWAGVSTLQVLRVPDEPEAPAYNEFDPHLPTRLRVSPGRARH